MPAPTLVTIRPGVQFVQPAASSWLRMEKAVGRPISTNSTYRNWDKQYELWEHWEKTGKPPRALHPDSSMHCKGLAADTSEVSLLKSLKDYGWRQTASDEDWHFEYKINLDLHVNDPAGGGSKPLPIEIKRKQDDMILLQGIDSSSGTTEILAVAAPGLWDRYSLNFKAALVSQFGDPVVLEKASMVQKETLYKSLAPVPVKVAVTAQAVN